MYNVHIKNSVVDVSVRSGNCVRCKQNCVYKQNICDKNTSEVQNFKTIIGKEDKCKSMGQRNIARKHNIKKTTEGYNTHDLSLTHILPHKQSIKIYHQNIKSLRNKRNELLCHLNHDRPHILCLTEHRLHHDELASLLIENCTLGAYYCRKSKHKCGVCMFVHNGIKFSSLSIDNYCLDQDFKVCAIHLNSVYDKLCILAIYRSPLGNFNTFLTNFNLIFLTYPLNIVYNNRALTVTENINFLGMHLNCNLIWISHIEILIKKLSLFCFMLRKLLPIVNVKVLHKIYFAYFNSHIIYGIVFWGSSSSMSNVFLIQKRAIRIMLRLGPRSSCREGFKKLDILKVPCLCICALMLFAVKNLNIYPNNSSVHGMNTRQQNKLHITLVRLFSIQRVVCYSSVKIFNQLPQNVFKYYNNIHILLRLC